MSIIINLLTHFGRYTKWLSKVFQKPENWKMYYKETVRQMYDIGIGSFVIICIISIFIGAVTAVQFSYQIEGTFIPRYYIGYIVRDTMIIELSATFSCMVLAGKIGSTMAAEIGGMRQKEHIDAMELMGVNTSSYLVLPKIVGAMIVIPILVSISAIVGIYGGYFAMVTIGQYTNAEYVQGLRSFFNSENVTFMYVKAVTFAYIITSVSSYQGYFVKGGSIELGQASTRAVVFSCILILVADLIIALILTA